MKLSINKLGVFFIHAFCWILFTVANHLINAVNYAYSDEGPLIPDTMVKYLGAAFIFYSNYLLIGPLLLNKKKYFLSTIALILLSFFSFVLKELLFNTLFPLFGYEAGPFNFLQAYVLNLWWFMMYTLLGLGYSILQERIRRAREKSKLEQERLRIEYAYLKSQINPHFLLNALNSFYAESIGGPPKLTKGILYLAEIMRYAISNGEDQDGLILVDSEIKQINNMIGINQLRFDDTLNIQFDIDGDTSEVKIIPLVILTLVENAFKHGKLSDHTCPLVIKISFDERNKIFKLLIKNKKGKNEQPSGGLGMENIRKRLALTYGERHSLLVQEDNLNYSVNLAINL